MKSTALPFSPFMPFQADLAPQGLSDKAKLKLQSALPSIGTEPRTTRASLTEGGFSTEQLADWVRKLPQKDEQVLQNISHVMENYDPHFSSLLLLRTNHLAQSVGHIELPCQFEHPQAELIAKDLQHLVSQPLFQTLLSGLSKAISRGQSFAEIRWSIQHDRWFPSSVHPLEPRLFTLQHFPQRPEPVWVYEPLRHKIPNDELERSLWGRVVRHSLHGLSHERSLGLSHLCALNYLCKRSVLRHWMGFTEVFGLPLRIGKYGMQSTTEDIAMLRSAVSRLGVDAAAVMPEHMQVEFVHTEKNGGTDLFASFTRWLDEQSSKAVLGQVGTSDASGSYAQAKVHQKVRQDLLEYDRRLLEQSLQRDLIQPWIEINFGPLKHYPRLKLTQPPEGLSMDQRLKLVGAVSALMDKGQIAFSEDEFKKLLKLSDSF